MDLIFITFNKNDLSWPRPHSMVRRLPGGSLGPQQQFSMSLLTSMTPPRVYHLAWGRGLRPPGWNISPPVGGSTTSTDFLLGDRGCGCWPCAQSKVQIMFSIHFWTIPKLVKQKVSWPAEVWHRITMSEGQWTNKVNKKSVFRHPPPFLAYC